MLESIAANLATSLLLFFGNKVNEFTNASKNDYERELKNIIHTSLLKYQSKYPIDNNDKTPFYQSKTLVEQLLKFRFSTEFNQSALMEALDRDAKVQLPTKEELGRFFEILDTELEQSDNLKRLNIDNNYKEEIFNITEFLNRRFEELFDRLESTSEDLKKEIQKHHVNSPLAIEWKQQIDEITEDLKAFKPQTATQRLEKLEKRITENDGFSDKMLKAKFIFLKALCLQENGWLEFRSVDSTLFIQAWKLNPNNSEYKVNAALGYVILEDHEKADKLASEILKVEEYNRNAWAVKCFMNVDDTLDFIKNIVPKVVKERKDFKIQISHWLRSTERIEKLSELEAIGLPPELDKLQLPKNITFNNKNYWIIVAQHCLMYYNEQNPVNYLFLPSSNAKKDYLFDFTNKLLKKITNTFKGTELEARNANLTFQYHYTNFQKNHDVNEVRLMEEAYYKIEKKSPDQVFQLSQAIIFIDRSNNLEKALNIIDTFGAEKHQLLLYKKSVLLLHIQKRKNYSWEIFIQYLNLYEELNEEIVYNLLQYCDLAFRFNKDTLEERGKYILEHKKFKKPHYENLFAVFTKVGFDVDIKEINLDETIDNLCNNNTEDEPLVEFMTRILFKNQNFKKAVAYLNPIIDKSLPNKLLLMYCEALYKSNQHIPQLLEIAETWRNTAIPNFGLLNIELHIRGIQHNWKEIRKVAKVAIEFFPKDEVYLYYYFSALDYFKDIEAIKRNLHLVEDLEYKNEVRGVNIVGVLWRAGLKIEALNLIYRLASSKNNSHARSTYFTFPNPSPKTLFVDFEKVELNTYVKLELKGETKTYYVNHSNINNPLINKIIGKEKGDEFEIELPLSSKQIKGKVLRIMDKYLTLFDDITEEADSPFSTLSIRAIKFDETFSVENFERTLIEEFGENDEKRKRFINKRKELFYQGKITFTEVVAQAFNRKSIETYLRLTAKDSECFRVLPESFAQNKSFDKKTKFVLDTTSLMLFYELSRELSIQFKHKFVISVFLQEEVENIVEEIKIMPATELSIGVSTEGVTPHFYDKAFNNRRKEYFYRLLDWVNNNCEVDYVEEKLETVLQLKEITSSDAFLNYYVDNRVLAGREKYILLSSDLFYFQKGDTLLNKIINPKVYLNEFHEELEGEIIEILLEKGYLGINLDEDTLIREYQKQINSNPNTFSICLQNLNFFLNPSITNISITTQFLRKILLEIPHDSEERIRIASNIFSHVIYRMPIEYIRILRNSIKEEFLIMKDLYYEVEKALEIAAQAILIEEQKKAIDKI